jgi:hypothetical protein
MFVPSESEEISLPKVHPKLENELSGNNQQICSILAQFYLNFFCNHGIFRERTAKRIIKAGTELITIELNEFRI